MARMANDAANPAGHEAMVRLDRDKAAEAAPEHEERRKSLEGAERSKSATPHQRTPSPPNVKMSCRSE
jgi:hypothetical protein